MVFGFALAVLAGWLLGERPPSGHAGADAGVVAMIALAVAWFLARILLFTGPLLAAAVVEMAFLLAVALLAWRRDASRASRWRVAGLLAMAAADAVFFLEQAALLSVPRGKAALAAFYVAVLLASFASGSREPAPRLALGATLATALAFACALLDASAGTASFALVAGVLQLLAWLRTAPATGSPEQRWSFGLAHAWLIAGLGLLGLEAIQPPWGATSTHAFGFGLLGGVAFTLLPGGHPDDGYERGAVLRLALLMLLHAGVLARVAGAFVSPLGPVHAWLLSGSALAWASAFAIWLAAFGLARTRRS